MRLRNSSRSWGLVARILHWGIAVLIVGQFASGWLAENESNQDASAALVRSHFQFGTVLAGLIVMRILWRLSNRRPSEHTTQPRWQTVSAAVVHGLMYITFIILPVSGYIVWVHMKEAMDVFGLFTIPRLFTPSVDGEALWSGSWYVHYFTGWALIGLICTHIAAALWHQFVLRDGLIRRMTTGN